MGANHSRSNFGFTFYQILLPLPIESRGCLSSKDKKKNGRCITLITNGMTS